MNAPQPQHVLWPYTLPAWPNIEAHQVLELVRQGGCIRLDAFQRGVCVHCSAPPTAGGVLTTYVSDRLEAYPLWICETCTTGVREQPEKRDALRATLRLRFNAAAGSA